MCMNILFLGILINRGENQHAVHVSTTRIRLPGVQRELVTKLWAFFIPYTSTARSKSTERRWKQREINSIQLLRINVCVFVSHLHYRIELKWPNNRNYATCRAVGEEVKGLTFRAPKTSLEWFDNTNIAYTVYKNINIIQLQQNY